MTTYYNAMQSIVEAANIAMTEIINADDACLDASALDEKLREVWEPVAEALADSIPENFNEDYPALAAFAEGLGTSFVGVTSDTRHVVRWGKDYTVPNLDLAGHEFVIEPIPDGAIAWKYGDPTEPARWVFDKADYYAIAYAIAAEDFGVLVPVNADKDD